MAPNQKLGIIVPDKLSGEYDKDGNVIAITATRYGNDEIIVLRIVDVTKPGSYAFNGDSSRSARTQFRGNKIDEKGPSKIGSDGVGRGLDVLE